MAHLQKSVYSLIDRLQGNMLDMPVGSCLIHVNLLLSSVGTAWDLNRTHFSKGPSVCSPVDCRVKYY